MSDPAAYPAAHGRRCIWLFAANLAPEDFAGYAKAAARAGWDAPLGAAGLKPEGIEAFLAEDIAEIGLRAFLVEAHGMDEAAVAADAGQLDGLAGPVVLVFSSALPARAGLFAPEPPMRLIGRYCATGDLAPAAPKMDRPSARGHIEGPQGPAPGTRSLHRAALWTVAALVALALVVWAVV